MGAVVANTFALGDNTRAGNTHNNSTGTFRTID
jgi:hypothetical protein